MTNSFAVALLAPLLLPLAHCGPSPAGSTPDQRPEPETPSADAGTRADANAMPPPPALGLECRSDRDCDGRHCNAPARCEGGRCAGGQPCENPDPEHCTVECVRSDGRAECVVRAADADGDGQGDQRCDASPGDDCQDRDPAVHAGAEEQCNGRDDDCDGLEDLEDDLPFVHAPEPVVHLPGPGDVLLAEHAGSLAILHGEREGLGQSWRSVTLRLASGPADGGTAIHDIAGLSLVEPSLRSDGTTLWLAAFSPSGIAVVRPLFPPGPDVPLWPARTIGLASGPRALVAWHGATLGETGPFLADPSQLGADPAVLDSGVNGARPASLTVAAGEGATAIAWSRHDGFEELPRLTAEVGVTVLRDGAEWPREVILEARAGDYTVEEAVQLDLGQVRPLVAWTGTRFLVAWFDERGVLELAALDSDGDVTCGPVEHPHVKGTTTLSQALVPRGRSDEAILAFADPWAAARMLVVDARCRTVGTGRALTAEDRELSRGSDRLAPGDGAIGVPAVTSTADGFAFAWIERPRRTPLPSPGPDGSLTDPDGGVDNPGDAGAGSAGERTTHTLVVRRAGRLLCD